MLADFRTIPTLIAFTALSCGDGTTTALMNPNNGPSGGPPTTSLRGGQGPFRLDRVTHGFGQLLPYRTNEYSSVGGMTGGVVDIRSLADVREHVRTPDDVLATPVFPTTATLPNQSPGNHFVHATFLGDVDPESVFALPASTALTQALSLVARDPSTGLATPVSARVLVGGRTAVMGVSGPELATWAQFDPSSGRVLALVPDAAGLPALSNARRRALVEANSIVFIADTDDDLSTFETFPAGVQLELRLTRMLSSDQSQFLDQPAFVATTVGADTIPPQTAVDSSGALAIVPPDGAVDVDPMTEVMVRFTEAVQPRSLGQIESTGPSVPFGAVSLRFGPAAQRMLMPISVEPVGPYDLSEYRVIPAFAFPGLEGPGATVQLSLIEVHVIAPDLLDLSGLTNTTSEQTTFQVGAGPGIVNAPVLPDAVLALRTGGGSAAASVVDLNGFGASTGNPVSSPGFPLKGESRFPFNPNVAFNPTVRPQLPRGTTTLDGGSAGVFTLTLDSSLRDEAFGIPIVASIQDAHVGHSLDTVFRNAPPPFGCQAGGGNVCALDGLKVIGVGQLGNGQVVPNPGPIGSLAPGYGNLISWAPHPNPPPLQFPAQCLSPNLQSAEPTSVDSSGLQNLLVPGDPFGDFALMIPPTGLLAPVQNAYFQGVSFGQTHVQNCQTYMMRQQIGHFLYVADRARSEVVVLNSNRMYVIDRIPVIDPTQFAMSPNLDILAVTNRSSDTVTMIDIDPRSATLHTVIAVVAVGDGPRGVAWSPDNEDALVCNELDGTVSIVSAASLQVRRTVAVPAGQPFDVVATPREIGFGFGRQVYYGYVLCRGGDVSVFESGPNGVNGWGYDDIIGTLPFTFQAPKSLQLNPTGGATSFVVAYEGPVDPMTGLPGSPGDGAVSTVIIESALVGVIPLLPNTLPQFRSIQYGVNRTLSVSAGDLSGIPTDVAYDELFNRGALPAMPNAFSAGAPLPANSKATVRLNGATIGAVNAPRFLMTAIPREGRIDVLNVGAAGSPRVDVDIYLPGVQSIVAPNVTALTTYWRQ